MSRPTLLRSAPALAALAVALAGGCSLIVDHELANKGSGGAASSASSGRAATSGTGGASSSSSSSASGGAPASSSSASSGGSGGMGGATSSSSGGMGGASSSSTSSSSASSGCGSIDTLMNCGACGVVCDPAHANATCGTGTCTITSCVSPYADCNGNVNDGCEADTTTIAACGKCDNPCPAGRACTAGVCGAGPSNWLSTTTSNAPNPRMMAAATWIGTGVYLWGGTGATGLLGDGWIYDDYLDQWTGTNNAGAPSSRVLAGVAWTGKHAVVWGGAASNGGAAFGTGGIYVPSPTDAWAQMSSTGAPAARQQPIMVWTGTYVVVWGGSSNGVPVAGGARYDDATATWMPISTTGAPPQARLGWAWAWTGTQLLLFGGRDAMGTVYGDGYGYDPANDLWKPMGTAGGEPYARSDAFGAWTSGKFVVWGGLDANGMPIDKNGAAYSPSLETWAGISEGGAPPTKRSAPAGHTGWTAFSSLTGQAILLGGLDPTAMGPAMFKTGGALYAPAPVDTWSAVASWPPLSSPPPPPPPPTATHEWGVAVWTGQEMVLWSGIGTGMALTQTGDRFMP